MKFSENWLRQHVRVDASHARLLDALTAIGLEVEASTVLGADLAGVVVGRIVSIAPHPGADRLRICQVDAGGERPLQIVCGAPNARVGMSAPLALAGARVGETVIAPVVLRGVASDGMLCSASELGLDADAAGLFELPDDAPPGMPLAEYLGLPDASIELKLTPNRADCLSIRGLAFDVAAALGGRIEESGSPSPVAATCAATVPVRVTAGADAPRYLGRVIEGVDASRRTPIWMAERLRRGGIRPISLLVDITQYVMLELGQPMHAFDRDRLRGTIGVRHGRQGERLTLLDGKVVAIAPDMLVIADDERAIALAGIMGGLETRVTEASRNIFLESAHFVPGAIIGRARRLGLHTEASHRYERGVDPELPRLALETATRLVLELAGGRAGPVVEAESTGALPQPRRITLRRARLARVLGLRIDDAEVERILSALGLEVTASVDGWSVVAPTRRFDLTLEEDLIEEVARIHGYERIPATLPSSGVEIVADSEVAVGEADLRRQIVARDYLETLNYSFTDAASLRRWGMAQGSVALANPLSAELAVMRTSLLPGLAAVLARNQARQQNRLRLFELGRVFIAAAAGEPPHEIARLAAIACGDARAEQWGEPARKLDFHDLKGDLDSIAMLAGVRLEYRPEVVAHAHPGRSAGVYRDRRRIGWIGQLHPRLQAALGLDGEVYAFELDLEALSSRRSIRAPAALSRYPTVRRDLAIVVPEQVPWQTLAATVREAAGPLLRELRLFDRYLGAGVETGHKSLAIGLILQQDSSTLSEQQVERVMAAVVARLKADHGAQIRS